MRFTQVRLLIIAGAILYASAGLASGQGNNTAEAMRNVKKAQGTLDKMTKAVDAIDARKKRKSPTVVQRIRRAAPVQRVNATVRPKRQPAPAPKPKP